MSQPTRTRGCEVSEDTRLQVMFLLPSLRGGGAERVTLRLLEHLDRERFRTHLVLVQHTGELLGAVPAHVEVTALNRSRVRHAVVDLVNLLRRRPPDILFSVMTHCNQAAAIAKLLHTGSAHLIVSEHATLSFRTRDIGRPQALLLRYLYGRADAVVAVSRGVASDIADRLGWPLDKLTVIYNPVVAPSLLDKASAGVDHPWFAPTRRIPVILGCGRLVPQKGFQYLLEAVQILNKKTEARLAILGKGPEREALLELTEKLGLCDSVAFLGYRRNPYRFMAHADIFALSSLWEGLGMVVIEAMACRTPVVSTDCPSGPAEIISDHVSGILVPPQDPKALAEALLQVLADSNLAMKLAENGYQRAQAFHVSTIVRQYERLFLTVAGRHPNLFTGR